MECSDRFDAAADYWFQQGSAADSPILLPLPGHENAGDDLAQFCRRICPGAPLLVVNLARLRGGHGNGRIPAPGAVAGRLAEIIAGAVAAHGLRLVPIIAVGNKEGADLAVCLGLAHGALLGACILLRPTAAATLISPRALNGVHVLLVRQATDEAPEKAGAPLDDILRQAGATVICEPAPDEISLGPAEVAIVRVFAAALFGH